VGAKGEERKKNVESEIIHLKKGRRRCRFEELYERVGRGVDASPEG